MTFRTVRILVNLGESVEVPEVGQNACARLIDTNGEMKMEVLYIVCEPPRLHDDGCPERPQ